MVEERKRLADEQEEEFVQERSLAEMGFEEGLEEMGWEEVIGMEERRRLNYCRRSTSRYHCKNRSLSWYASCSMLYGPISGMKCT